MAHVRVRVSPGSRKKRLEHGPDGEYRAFVTAPAREGMANRALVELLARYLEVPKSRITIVRGAATRHKVVEVLDLTDAELSSRLSAVCSPAADC